MLSTSTRPVPASAPAGAPDSARLPLGLCLFLGLGGLATGAIGPLYSTFVPPMVARLVSHDGLVGLILAIDNLLLFLLVPWTGALSDRRAARGLERRPLIVFGLLTAAAGMLLLRSGPAYGLAVLLAGIVVVNVGQFVVRAPFQAVMADLVPSRHRSFATGAMTALMCAGAIAFLGLAQASGSPRLAFAAAAVTLVGVALAFGRWLREPAGDVSPGTETSLALVRNALRHVAHGAVPGLRAAFVALLFIHLSFQTFASWFTLHAAERFGTAPADAAAGFIAWAVGGLIGSLPAGLLGVRVGRRATLLLGLAGMTLVLLALDRAPTLAAAIPLILAASACWTLPTVNAFPLLVEPFPRARRGVLAALFFLCMALGGIIGDPLNGLLFELAGHRRALFLLMAGYTAIAFLAVLRIPRGAGEAGTGAA